MMQRLNALRAAKLRDYKIKKPPEIHREASLFILK